MCIKQENPISVCLYGCLGKGLTLPTLIRGPQRKGVKRTDVYRRGSLALLSWTLLPPPTGASTKDSVLGVLD